MKDEEIVALYFARNEDARSLKGYVGRIAHNLALTMRRGDRRFPLTFSEHLVKYP